jgi:predicted RND superfamily exporter protein
LAVTPFRKRDAGKSNNKTRFEVMLENYSRSLLRNQKPILVGYFVAGAILISLSFTNVFNDNYVKYFSPEIQFRRDTDHIMKRLTGIYNIDFSIKGGEEQSITNPEYLSLLDKFEEWLVKKQSVTHVIGIHDVIKRVNKSMHGDDEQYFAIPGTSDLTSQYLLVYEMSVPYGLDLSSQINLDKSSSKFSVLVGNISFNELLKLTEEAEQWLIDNVSTEMVSTGASVPIMFAHLGQRQTRGMVKGGIIALTVISVLLIVLLRNAKLGVMSLIPNLFPVFVAFGIWSIFIGEVNSATAMVFGMTLGIIVDDTVHMLVKYNYARKSLGFEVIVALQYVTVRVGKAIIATSLILFAGFAVLGFSNFEMNSAMGQMSGLVIIAALILDLTLLPVLIFLLEKKKSQSTEGPIGALQAVVRGDK